MALEDVLTKLQKWQGKLVEMTENVNDAITAIEDAIEGGGPPAGETPVVSVEAVVETIAESDVGTQPIAFRFTRSAADLSGVSIVDWTRSGTANDDDLVDAPLSGQFRFEAGETEHIGEFTLKDDIAVEPGEMLVITLTNPVGCKIGTEMATVTIIDNDDEVEPPVDPPTTGEWVCAKPHMGPIRRVAPDRKILLCNNVGDISVTPFRQRIPDLFTGSVFMVGNLMGAAVNPVVPWDHSAAGIARHATIGFDSFVERRARQNNTRCIWFDIEADIPSINVPAAVGYSAAKSKTQYQGNPGYCNTYAPEVREKEWRDEAVRFSRLLFQALIDEAKKREFDNFEMGAYNLPRETSLGNVNNTGRYTQQGSELNQPLLCPYLAFGGGNCYPAAGAEATRYGMTDAQVVARTVAKARTQIQNYRKAFPLPQKIIPAIFNCWVNPTQTLNDDIVVPAGCLRDITNAILDAGADGIFIYENTLAENRLPHAQERYDEVVDVIKQRGDFVNPYA